MRKIKQRIMRRPFHPAARCAGFNVRENRSCVAYLPGDRGGGWVAFGPRDSFHRRPIHPSARLLPRPEPERGKYTVGKTFHYSKKESGRQKRATERARPARASTRGRPARSDQICRAVVVLAVRLARHACARLSVVTASTFPPPPPDLAIIGRFSLYISTSILVLTMYAFC